MRRGVLELPQEAAENAAEMRRVIVEQIDALAELNRIVARHGRAMDAVEPVRPLVREEAMAAVASATGQRTPLRSDIALDRPPPPRRPEPRPAGDNGRGGWLSDVLARASREEEPTEPRSDFAARPQGRGALDTLSIDIARMVDHDAAVELWDLRQRGEHGAFDSRLLYTPQGQQTFEEIRRKYRGDRDFKQTVDRYIAEFERLLDEVAHDDRASAVAHSYLTSETGKVYTMLAHAAGRLD
jgi:hypothetical protein